MVHNSQSCYLEGVCICVRERGGGGGEGTGKEGKGRERREEKGKEKGGGVPSSCSVPYVSEYRCGCPEALR